MSTSMQEHMAMTDESAREIEDMSRQAETALMEIDAMARGALTATRCAWVSANMRLTRAFMGLTNEVRPCPD